LVAVLQYLSGRSLPLPPQPDFEAFVIHDHTKPEADQQVEPKTRPCLVCKTPFLSEWSGERICRRCKSAKIWRGGGVATQRGR
jgi:hypothetical protein